MEYLSSLSASFLHHGHKSPFPPPPPPPPTKPLFHLSKPPSSLALYTRHLHSTAPPPQNTVAPLALVVPLAACLVFSACAASPVEAGLLSGTTGLESFELPSIPGPEFLKKIQEENRKKYEGYDAKFKSSPLLEELLKRSKENAEKHKQEIQDKYCERGADWGVGDCSLAGMSNEQREAFLKALKKRGSPE